MTPEEVRQLKSPIYGTYPDIPTLFETMERKFGNSPKTLKKVRTIVGASMNTMIEIIAQLREEELAEGEDGEDGDSPQLELIKT